MVYGTRDGFTQYQKALRSHSPWTTANHCWGWFGGVL